MLEITKTCPEGYHPIEDILQLKRLKNEKLKKGLYDDSNLEANPQQIFVYYPREKMYYPKWYWSAVLDKKIDPLIKKGLVYANR